jgi:RND family efflux transporter MFP subunit
VDVTAEIEGHVEQMRVRLGDVVERGEVIATVDKRPLQHELAIERAAERTAVAEKRSREIEVRRAEQEYQRRLALEGLVSEEDKERSRFQRETALAQLEESEAAVSRVTAQVEQLEATLSRSEIRAPFAGTVAQRYLDAGAMVSAGTPVVRLISSESFLARFAVPPEEIAALPIGTPVRIELETLDLTLDAVVEQVAPEIDAASQMIFIEAGLSLASATDRTLPSGAVARVSVATSNLRPPSCLDEAHWVREL